MHTPADFLAIYRSRLDRPMFWQARLLSELLKENAGTEFGRKHGFSKLSTFDDYRAAVPIREYVDFEALIRRGADGERNLLTAADPEAYCATSGTTGEPKLFPVMGGRGPLIFMVGFAAMRECHHLPTGCGGLNLATDNRPVDTRTKGGFRLAPLSRLAPRGGVRLPDTITEPKDRMLCRVVLAMAAPTHFVFSAYPSKLFLAATWMDEYAAELIEAVRTGCFRSNRLGPGKPSRAEALSSAPALTPGVAFPDLRVLWTWNTSYAGRHAEAVRDVYQVPSYPFPYVASEAEIAAPVDDHPTSTVPNTTDVLFELQELHSDRTLALDQVSVGERYRLVTTSRNGLYRFRNGDVIKVTGTYRDSPRIEFVYRNRVLHNYCGDHFNEERLLQMFELIRRRIDAASVTAFVDPDEPRYCFILEAEPAPSAVTAELERAIDEDFASRLPRGRAHIQGAMKPTTIRFADRMRFCRSWIALIGPRAFSRPSTRSGWMIRMRPAGCWFGPARLRLHRVDCQRDRRASSHTGLVRFRRKKYARLSASKPSGEYVLSSSALIPSKIRSDRSTPSLCSKPGFIEARVFPWKALRCSSA
jgi:hypothetical protein